MLISLVVLNITFISNVLFVLQNFTTALATFLGTLKSFFARHSSEYQTSDSDRKINRNVLPDEDIRDRTRLTGPKNGQLGPIYHCLLEEST